MKLNKSYGFIIAGMFFIMSSLIGKTDSGMVAVGCSFIAIGAALARKNGR
jgi:hypothetical protein